MSFGLFCKSFAPDVERFGHLFRSFVRFASDDIPFVLSVPETDRSLFEERYSHPRLTVVTDEELCGEHAVGWPGQQLVKMAFGWSGHLDAWLVVDSDFIFIRPFDRSEFFQGDKIALVMATAYHTWEHGRAELLSHLEHPLAPLPLPTTPRERVRLNNPLSRLWDWYAEPDLDQRRDNIQRWFRPKQQKIFFLPGPVWTKDSLCSLRDWLASEQKMDVKMLLKRSPWEAAWVGEWEIYRGAPGRFLRQPFFVHFATAEGVRAAKLAGLSTEKLATRYLGIALAARHYDIDEY